MTWKHLTSRDARKKPAADILRALNGMPAGTGRVTVMSRRGPVLLAGSIAEVAELHSIELPPGVPVQVIDIAGHVHVPLDAGGKTVLETQARVFQIGADELVLIKELGG